MNETESNPLPLFPSSNEFAAAAQYRMYGFALVTFLVALLCAVAYLFLPSIIVPILIVIVLLAPILLWSYPRLTCYVIFAGICLLEVSPVAHKDSITDRIPFFINVNTIVQVYTHNDFKEMPFSPLELLLCITGVVSYIRGVYSKCISVRVGPLFWPLCIYCIFVVMGWINGMMTGGDFKISSMEVRPEFYLMVSYLMAVNVLRKRSDIDTTLWISAICIAIKGILYTFRRYVTMAGEPLPDQGVGSHEEAFLFSAYIVLLFLLTLVGGQKRLIIFMWTMLPWVVLGDLATNRRAGIGALIIAMPLMLMALDRAVPRFRTRIRVLGVVMLICFSIYYPAFKNNTGTLGQPAHAINSLFDPDARDASSNLYRDAENADLMATIKLAPIQGYGYGKRMLHAVPIADISKEYEYWDVMTHNSVLWVWMRVGTLGFFAFWFMMASLLIYACRALRSENADMHTKSMGIFTLVLIAMVLIFGLLDLGLTNFRDMLYVGMWVGALGAATEAQKVDAASKDVPQ